MAVGLQKLYGGTACNPLGSDHYVKKGCYLLKDLEWGK